MTHQIDKKGIMYKSYYKAIIIYHENLKPLL